MSAAECRRSFSKPRRHGAAAYQRQEFVPAMDNWWGLSVRVNQGPFRDHLFSASGGNDAATKGALTNDYPERSKLRRGQLRVACIQFGSQAMRSWPHELARIGHHTSIEVLEVVTPGDSNNQHPTSIVPATVGRLPDVPLQMRWTREAGMGLV